MAWTYVDNNGYETGLASYWYDPATGQVSFTPPAASPAGASPAVATAPMTPQDATLFGAASGGEEDRRPYQVGAESMEYGAPLWAMFEDGTFERLFENAWGPHADGPFQILESEVPQYATGQLISAGGPDNPTLLPASYNPAGLRFPRGNDSLMDQFMFDVFPNLAMIGMTAGTGIGTTAAAAAAGAGNAMVQTGSLKDAASAGLMSAAIPAASNWLAPYLSEMFGDAALSGADERLLTASDALPMRSTPAQTFYGPDGAASYSTPATTTMGAEGMLSFDVPTMSLSSAPLMPAAVVDEDPAAYEGDLTPETADPLVTPEDLQRYAKIAKKVYDLVQQPDGPQQSEGQSDEEYAGQLVDYLGLDPQTMADAGLTPGTPEYYEYIMAQADAIISQVLGDMDVDSEQFAQQLRTKTTEEQQSLVRALYVRGQMDQLMGSGTYTDPTSGEAVDVIGPDGSTFNPGLGGYQAGLAGDIDELGGLRGNDAMDYLQGMLGRRPDFFGMQAQADEQFELAKRTEQDDERKRRGMFSSY
jgi:hypothetical protein